MTFPAKTPAPFLHSLSPSLVSDAVGLLTCSTESTPAHSISYTQLFGPPRALCWPANVFHFDILARCHRSFYSSDSNAIGYWSTQTFVIFRRSIDGSSGFWATLRTWSTPAATLPWPSAAAACESARWKAATSSLATTCPIFPSLPAVIP